MNIRINLQSLPTHLTQSPEWGIFKTKMGTSAIQVDGIQFTLHKLPFLPFNIAYCPKSNPAKINWDKIKDSARRNHCIFIRFDVPNIPILSNNFWRKWQEEFAEHCQKAPRDTFAKATILIDLTKTNEKLLAEMHPKTRYNIRLAIKKGVKIEEKHDTGTLEIFLRLQQETASRQKFYIHSDNYYKTLWKILAPKGMAHFLIASYDGEPIVIWFLINFKSVLYYPYGGSSLKYKNMMASNLVGWEAIQLGKRFGCNLFDMWGITTNEDQNDPWYGFTRFKQGFGGQIIKFIDSYDLVINPLVYRLFNLSYKISWRFLRLKKLLCAKISNS